MRLEIQTALLSALNPPALNHYLKRLYWLTIGLNYHHIVTIALGQVSQSERLRAVPGDLNQLAGEELPVIIVKRHAVAAATYFPVVLQQVYGDQRIGHSYRKLTETHPPVEVEICGS